MTARAYPLAAALLAVAAACWVVTADQMRGMDMGTETELGSFGFFMGAWLAMMAAMMLPGAVPAVSRFVSAGRRAVVAAPLFAGSYLVVWVLVGIAVYAAYEPHSSEAAGALVIAAGLYELTPLKRHCRERCQEETGSGFDYGRWCVGSSAGLMVVLVALGVMNVALMAAVAVVVVAQKLLPPNPAIDVPLGLAIVALGVSIVVT